jgi:heavy metal sensor kinase
VTLRLRLTVWYSAVLAGVLCLFGLAVFAVVSTTLTRQIDASLDLAADKIIEASSFSRILDSKIVSIPRDLDDPLGASNVVAQVWDLRGNLVSQSNNLAGFERPLDPQGLKDGRASLRDVFVDGRHLRVLTQPIVTTDGDVFGYLQTAASLWAVDSAQSVLLIVLILGGVVAVFLAALIGWLSASRALRPLDTVTQTALQITRADDLSRRIPQPHTSQDEVGRLIMAFNESLERLERLFTAQRRFLADVSHELRTPLTAIRGNVDLIQRMGGADPDSLRDIRSEVERMTRLVGDLLVLAQADSGSLPLAHQPVELDTLLLEVLRETKVLAGNVQVTIGDIDQLTVTGDRDRLKQVVLNLVSNALKFTPEGGRVTLGLCRVNQWARLTVSDTGVGIAPDELPKIFDRFYRVDKARSRAHGGAGIGLSIAQRIVQMHGGRIEAASEGVTGRGTTFSVWLPLAKGREAEIVKLPEAVSASAPR